MRIVSIEPTPSPNSMKIILNESLPDKESRNFRKERANEAPEYLKKLLDIDGVKSVFHVADFIALDRYANKDWKLILPKVQEAFGASSVTEDSTSNQTFQIDETFGEVKVFIQFFRGIPMQIKLQDGVEERRFGLPQRFIDAAMKAESSSNNLVMERQWKDKGVRYGDMEEIGLEVEEEISAAYDDKRLHALVEAAYKENDKAKNEDQAKLVKIPLEEVEKSFLSDDWKVRYAAFEKLDPTEESLPVLAKALHDEKVSIRRLAAVYLGMIEDDKVLPYLYEALKDKSVTVRRTAGDCLSDLGNPKAIPAMIEALSDKNKLVRWRAAMFLYEVGDETALDALRKAEDDPEFEVSLQVKMAIKRIDSGEEAAGSVWQQMTQARKEQ